MKKKHASLFTGIGGFDLAAHWIGWQNIFQVEKDQKCTKVLDKNFPNTDKYEDIKEFDGEKYKNQIDILTGGFPCQPFSVAGKRNGESDDRHLWPEMFRIVREVKPPWIIGENVLGIKSMENGQTLETILTNLESEGYKVQPFIIPAAAVGAWHKRDRIWIIAYNDMHYLGRNSTNRRFQDETKENEGKARKENGKRGRSGFSNEIENAVTNNISKRRERSRKEKIHQFTRISWGKDVRGIEDLRNRSDIPKPLICRNDDGFSGRMDRLKQLGNAIVPQVAYEIFKMIEAYENRTLKTK